MAGINGAKGQQPEIRVEPPNWWVGMRDSNLQLMLCGEELAHYSPEVHYEGLAVESWHPGASPNYLFIDLSLSPQVRPGKVLLSLRRSGHPGIKLEYELKKRDKEADAYKGFDATDVIYLITPDRFANGNPDNDVIPGMKEQGVDRTDDYARHGGDIRGMIDHLDYIAGMGFTAIWPGPLLTNDMPRTSYHGYAITDFYEVDPRFGTLEEYSELSREARSRGVKLIMDQVVNHCGLTHWWMADLPFPDWIHYQREYLEGKPFTVTNHRRTVNQDPYASRADRELMNRGWFVPSMPDLNQDNPFLATYLIQNSIWWVETLQLGGIRQDTYPYPDKEFMALWARAIMEEYPNFSIVGEEWSYNPLLVGYWQHGAHNRDAYQSYLRSTMDFPLQQTLINALRKAEKWDSGLNMLYEGLANDFNYPRPADLLFFGDNHDMDRLFTQLGESVSLMEMALAFILTTPRIPQIYYGTELLMQNSEKPGDHGLIRTDFPGGWAGDTKNGFTGKGLNEAEAQMQEYLRRILIFRKQSPAILEGNLVHFAPEDRVYLLARSHGGQTVVVILNKNQDPVSLPLDRFEELGLDGVTLRNVITDDTISWTERLTLKGPGAFIFTTM
ncbi:MAG: alpha-amlyase [Bacteroidetes bacterium]|nr:MAG: alpha-amlyase [Bacteroidota bacterium]UCE69253.1 MAG: glycoside hydrolase family 13 protein [Flavobacteriaceae bacterium]